MCRPIWNLLPIIGNVGRNKTSNIVLKNEQESALGSECRLRLHVQAELALFLQYTVIQFISCKLGTNVRSPVG